MHTTVAWRGSSPSQFDLAELCKGGILWSADSLEKSQVTTSSYEKYDTSCARSVINYTHITVVWMVLSPSLFDLEEEW